MTDNSTTSGKTGSTYILDALEREGISNLFGLIGEGNSHLIDSTNDHSVEFTYARHEQVAVGMADGYARLTGDVAVCTLTHGPGVTNGATGIAAADRDNVPLVILVGDTGFSGRETSLQYLDHKTFTAPISVYQTRVETPETLPETLRRAFAKARANRGPAIIELPTDIQDASAPEIEYRPIPRVKQHIHPDPTHLEEAVSLLSEADHPAILAGGGAMHADAADAVVALAETVGAPIATTYFAKGLFADDHPLHSGIAGTFMTPANDELLWDTDVIVTVGAQLSGKSTRYGALFEDAEVIQIDIDPNALGRHRDPTVGILGDARATVEHLADSLEAYPDRTATIKSTIQSVGTTLDFDSESTSEWIDPRELTMSVADRVPDDVIITVDSGNNTGFPAVFHPINDEGRMFINGNFGTMGYALPAAIGVQYGAPDKTVVCYAGDGSLLQVIQDIETAVRLELPIVLVVLNDESYGIIRHRQLLEFERQTAAEYSSPDFATIARGFGARTATVRSTADLDVLDDFLDERPSIPLVLDARTHPDVARPGFPPY
ncbi:thiamine pyrophosphate-binding protein [Haladaptatus sp. NG-WS-4]